MGVQGHEVVALPPDAERRAQASDVKRMIKTLRTMPAVFEDRARRTSTLKSLGVVRTLNTPDYIGTQYMSDANVEALNEKHSYTKASDVFEDIEHSLEEVLNSNKLMSKELEDMLKKLNESVPDKALWAKQAMEVGAGLAMTGDGKRATDILTQCLDALTQRYGMNSPEVARARTRMAVAHQSMGNYHEQAEQLSKAVAIWEKAPIPDIAEHFLALSDLSAASGSLGRSSQQMSYAKAAKNLLVKNQAAHVDDLTHARALTNMAAAHGENGDPTEKKDLLEQALTKLSNSRIPKSDIEMGFVLEHLATAYGDLGDSVSRLLLQQRALHLVRRHYGTEHVQYARVAANLGALCGEMGDPWRQRALLTKAYSIIEAQFGPDHIDTARTAVMLSYAYTQPDELKDGVGLLQRALRTVQAWYRLPHLDTVRVHCALASLHGRCGETQKKRDALVSAIAELKDCTTVSDHHTLLVDLHKDLADTCYDLGDFEGQAGELQRADEIAARGAHRPDRDSGGAE